MATVAEMKKANKESAILFMQQAHANTLKSLHEEIQGLQKKCSALTFQIAMQSTFREDDYKVKYEELQQKLQDMEEKYNVQVTKTSEKERISMLMRKQMEVVDKQFKRSLEAKSKQIGELSTELEAKSNALATLTNQIRVLRLRVPIRQTTGIDVPVDGHVPSPTPPPQGAARYRKHSKVVNRPASGRRISQAEDPVSTMLNQNPVMYSECEDPSGGSPARAIGILPSPPVLPPIRQPDDGVTINRALVHYRMKQQHDRAPSAGPPEMLAVEQLQRAGRQWIAEPRETESREY